MKKLIVAFISITLIFGLFQVTMAQQFAKVGTAGTQFLKIGTGARNVGLGNACVAIVDDASAVFWNPGGLAKVDNYSVMVSHIRWFADIQLNSVSIAKTLPGIGTIGLSALFLGSGEMDITTYQFQEGTGETFSKNDMMVGISFSRYLTDKFSFGGTLKYVREDYGTINEITGDDEITSALAFDVGAVYQTGFKSLRMGISIQNFGPEMQIPGKYKDIIGFDSKTQEYVTEPEDNYRPYHIPLLFRAGVAYDLLETAANKITVAGDLVHLNDNVEQVNLGGEYWFNNLICIRGGYIGNHDSANFSVGGSLNLSLSQLGAASLDYSYTDFGILDFVHQMSMTFSF
ncbi:PorV/PorQ family protein [candidate division KSB1 bacterium]|nr:PorV/PorQ family protein [candidate division KSB1 bacterium]